MIFTILVFFAWLFISLVVHELGHAFMAERLGYSAKISYFNVLEGRRRFGFNTVVSPFPIARHDFLILVVGFLSGFVFISFYALLANNIVFSLLIIGLYSFLTRDDLKQIFRGDF